MADKVIKVEEDQTAIGEEVTPAGEEKEIPQGEKADEEGEGAQIVEEPTLPSSEEQLAEAETLAAEYLDGWQRSRAELANYKRRTEAQRAEMTLSANAGLLEKLLPVLDDIQLALENSPTEPCAAENEGRKADDPADRDAAWEEWREGILLISHKFLSVLESVGVVPMETEGKLFDPNVHEAVTYEEHPEMESGQIIAEVRQGYMLGDRVLRATMVRVAR